jgi:hypothetical protein
MWHMLLSLVIGFLLIIHGIAHWSLPGDWGKSSTEHSWLLDNLHVGASTIHVIGAVLSIVTLFVFLAAGVTLFMHLSWWRTLTVIASVISLVLILLFWRADLVFGVLIDGGVLIALLVANGPSRGLLWA